MSAPVLEPISMYDRTPRPMSVVARGSVGSEMETSVGYGSIRWATVMMMMMMMMIMMMNGGCGSCKCRIDV